MKGHDSSNRLEFNTVKRHSNIYGWLPGMSLKDTV